MDALFERPFFLHAVLVLVTVVLPTVRARALAAAGLVLAALGIAADGVGSGAGGGTFATINEILMGGGAAIVGFAALRAWRERKVGPPPPMPAAPAALPDPLLLAGLLLAALGPHLILVAAGNFMALVSAAAAALRGRRPRWTGLVFLGAASLAAGFFLLLTILGPTAGRVVEIATGPFSPAAERLLAILLGLGSLALAGVFPFQLAPWRLSLSPVAAILLARVLVPALPEGLRDWQAPAMLWLAVAVAAAAFQGRWAGAMVAGGLLGLWSGLPEAVIPGGVLLLFGWLADARLLPPPAPFDLRGERWSGLWFALPAASIPFVLTAALQGQVLVSVLSAAAVVVGLALESRRRARAG